MSDANAAPTEAIPIPSPVPNPLSMREVLAIAPLRRLWYAQIVSVFGDFLALWAVIYVMTYTLRSSAQQLTNVQIAYLLPMAVLGILAGVFADRWPIKTTLISSDLLRGMLCLFLLLVKNPVGFYAALAAISVVSSFFTPAQGKAIRFAVPMHGMRSAQALMQQVMFILRIVGGPIAVAIVSVFGARACYVLDALSFIASASLISTVTLGTGAVSAVTVTPTPAPEPPNSAVVIKQKTGVARVMEDMKEGMSFIFHHAALLFVILALAAAMFVMGCFGPLIAVYVRDILHAQGRTFAITSAMIGIGLMIGINVLNAAGKKLSNNALVYLGLGGLALGTLLLGVLPYMIVAVLALFLIGFAAGGIIVPAQTMIQQETPQTMLGRVGSTVMSLIFSAQIAGLLLSGVLANYISIRRVFILCTIMLVLMLFAGRLWMEPKDNAPTPSMA